jgi:hypothetical protein
MLSVKVQLNKLLKPIVGFYVFLSRGKFLLVLEFEGL